MRLTAIVMLIFIPAALGAQTRDGFTPLFNGKDLEGWEVRESRAGDKDKWSVMDNLLITKPGGGWIGNPENVGAAQFQYR